MTDVCFVVLSHDDPDQVIRLITVLSTCPDSSIVVHHDGGRPQFRPPADLPVRLVPDPVAVQWGTWSQVRAAGAALRLGRDGPARPEWFVFLSGQDFPVRPLAELRRFLSDSEVDGHIASWPLADVPGWTQLEVERYTYRWRRLPRALSPGRLPQWARSRVQSVSRRHRLIRVSDRYGLAPDSVGRPARNYPVPPERMFGGSEWMMLRANAVDHLLDALGQARWTDFFRRSQLPTESFYHTVLAHSAGVHLDADWRRYQVYEGARAKVLGVADIPAIEASGAFFARKFVAAEDANVLDYFEPIAAGRPPSDHPMSPGTDG
ncbi:MAG TPA: hypothetical protein VG435_09245 [Acidimicrobiales bacterium]|jgi:hypothetical protein|nr:hypothetical protein [Acidimicrobiales bacterium]